MNALDETQPPSNVPNYLKYLLGLSQDSTRKEIEDAWAQQVIPLLNAGPVALFDREALQLMAAGISGEKARRVFKQTRRGSNLFAAAEREAKARQRAAASKPPFVK